jgi:hypothetical protein
VEKWGGGWLETYDVNLRAESKIRLGLSCVHR